MQKAKLSLIAAALLVPAFALSAYAADFVRPMPTHPIQAGPTLLGGEQPVICSPLVGKNLKAIKAEAKTVKALNPDMVEVRADYWDFIEDTDKAIEAERGFKKVGQKPKFDFYKKAAALKLPNLIDVELVYGADTIKNLKKDLNGVPVVVAYHDLKGTPSSEEIANILKKEIDAGGDVAKIVVKPNSQADVLRFLNGTLEFRTKNPAYPVIASASGQEGRITRLAGGLFGIDLTFASGVKGSNPWQMPVQTVQEINKCFLRRKIEYLVRLTR
ncbi:MAG: type I 3-dehydroquinate dehydratase [Parasutterella sp.]|uniref:type I 3-dehydroquinate dehydratase n=1 Tax=Parasutterella sp. TaxID=2049037 RepID=UPI00257C50BF|nr:type I 3-dehydroquinate dehydratase [Parasutterella sp.]MBS5225496.1 type I 3-dehydroquinate dehydratase [Parasutterella sp.]